jgi:hypothetical protein
MGSILNAMPPCTDVCQDYPVGNCLAACLQSFLKDNGKSPQPKWICSIKPKRAGFAVISCPWLCLCLGATPAPSHSRKPHRISRSLPESKDAFGGPEITAGVAEVHAILGDSGRAIEILDGLLSRPSTVTVPLLKLNPIWDPLRNDPRFQALTDKYAAKN